MHIQIPYKYSKDKLEAYNKVKGIMNTEYFSQWNVDVDIECAEEHPRIICQGNGFRLQINFEETSCEAYIELALKYKLFQGTIEKRISKELSTKL